MGCYVVYLPSDFTKDKNCGVALVFVESMGINGIDYVLIKEKDRYILGFSDKKRMVRSLSHTIVEQL